MRRITVTLDDELVAALDRTVAVCGYQNRSEALRDLARAGIAQVHEDADGSPDIAVGDDVPRVRPSGRSARRWQ